MSPSSTDTEAYKTDKPQTKTSTPANTRDNKRAKGKQNNITFPKETKATWHHQKPSSPTITSPGYLNTTEKQELDLKSYFMMLIEDFKKDIDNSLKEIQKNRR